MSWSVLSYSESHLFSPLVPLLSRCYFQGKGFLSFSLPFSVSSETDWTVQGDQELSWGMKHSLVPLNSSKLGSPVFL